MSSPDAEPGYRAIAGPTWRNEVAARFGLTAGLYRPGLQADRLPCPILVQIADRDAIAPPAAAQEGRVAGDGPCRGPHLPGRAFSSSTSARRSSRLCPTSFHFLGRHLSPASAAQATAAQVLEGAVARA